MTSLDYGDIHFATLHQHGIKNWGDCPWAYSLPAFSSNQNRSWRPSVEPQGGEIPGIEGSGSYYDRFGNKITVVGTGHGINGYAMILFDNSKRQITMQLHTMDEEREPSNVAVPGWPLTIDVAD